MEENGVKCSLCGSSIKILERNHMGYLQSDTFKICYCLSCNTQFSYPKVETSYIYDLIYKNAEVLPGYHRYYRYKNAVKTRKKPLRYLAKIEDAYWVIRELLKQEKEKQKTLKILEVGCGMGYLTYAIHKEGYKIIGLDISENAIKEATKDFGQLYICADVFDYANTHKDEYDLIILTQVFEHIEEPIKWAGVLMSMLNNDGKIIITTENKSIYPENAVWQTDLPPVHLWWFSEESMIYIANKLNANICFMDFSHCRIGSSGINIVPATTTPHFDNDGRLIPKEYKIYPKNPFFLAITKKNQFAQCVYRKYYYRIYSRYFKKHDIVFGKRRLIMGCVLTKKQL